MLEAEENIHWLKNKQTHSRDLQDCNFVSLSPPLLYGQGKWDAKRWQGALGHMFDRLYKPFSKLSFYMEVIWTSFHLSKLSFFPLCWINHWFTCLASLCLGSFLYCLASCKWLILNQCLRAQAPKTNCLVWVLTVPFTVYNILAK